MREELISLVSPSDALINCLEQSAQQQVLDGFQEMQNS